MWLTLLTSYLPIYMYSMTLQILSLVLKFLTIIYFGGHQEGVPSWLLRFISPICFPSSSLSNATSLANHSRKFIDPTSIIFSVMYNVTIFFTFGLCSPILGCYIIVYVTLQCSFWLIMVGRFIDFVHRKDQENPDPRTSSYLYSSKSVDDIEIREMSCIEMKINEKFDQNALNEESTFGPFLYQNSALPLQNIDCISILNNQVGHVGQLLYIARWPVVYTSCLFMTLLSWDIAGDAIGWYAAIWIPFTGLLMLVFLCTWDKLKDSWEESRRDINN